jgi:beta-1,4-mannosyl-glycoprotein beta-1,4-N-acetylglucosaminyltransferase
MIVDIFSYNGEADVLELRLNALGDIVDQFVIVEASSNFGGLPKPYFYLEQRERFAKWDSKIKHFKIDDNYTEEEVEQARASKYTGGDIRWMHEYLQKESIQKAITHLSDEDTVYIGDVDELWEHREPHGIEKLKLHVYTYYLNMLSTEEFWGPIRAQYKDVKGKCLNDIRNDTTYRTPDYQGWHFTNQGGLEAVKQKVRDQYTGVVFNDELVMSTILDERFGKVDYIGRPFVLTVDESHWPPYLKENKEKYKHLCL